MIPPRMIAPSSADATSGRREYTWVLLLIFLAILFRSTVFVFWERAHFDADQAITGLMAKHLAELRAFPVFWYGQSYMLAVESWITAPVFAVAGVSVPTLKLPLLVINFAVAWLLLRTFVGEVGLRPSVAAIPTLFFALPAAGTAARLVEANGGNVEPFLYVLLIWILRDRPAWCGFVVGLGFLQREFTLYGFAALLAVEALQGTLFTRTGIRKRLGTFRTAAEVWLVVFWLKEYSSGAGPGTTLGAVYQPHDNVTELLSRVCVDPRTAIGGFWRVATEHWPVLFGIQERPISDFGVVTNVTQGVWWSGIVLAAIAVIPLAGIGRTAWRQRSASVPATAFCGYLVATAVFSIAGYVIGKCGVINFYYTRYELLSVLGIAGLSAWFLRAQPSGWLRRAWLGLAVVWFVLTAVPHVRLLVEYVKHPPQDIRRFIIANLDAGGHRLAVSDYWIAYPITFLTNERIIVSSSDFMRVQEYERLVAEQRAGVVRISREPCERGRQILPRVWLCEP